MGVLVLPAMEVTVLDAVSGRDLLMPKLGAPLDTDTVPDMVLVDMEVTVLALPAMEDTDLEVMVDTAVDMEVMVDTAVDMEVMVDVDTVDTVERDLLMPGTDVAMVDTEDTDTVDTDTESKSYTSINLLPFILISSHYTY